MGIVEPGADTAGFVSRVKGMLLRPGAAWDEVAAEAATPGGLYRGYVVPLAAIAAVCGLIGALVGGFSLFGLATIRPSVAWAIGDAAISFAMSLAWVYVLALIIDSLAPRFGGRRDLVQALKLTAYAGTAAWVAGVFHLLPALGLAASVAGGLYSAYALYIGLPKLTQAPKEKTTAFFLVILAISLATAIAFGMARSHLRFTRPPPLVQADARELVLPGQATLDLDELDKTTRELSDAADAIRDGRGGASDPDALKALLPASLVGYRRAEVTTGSGGVRGMSGSSAEAVYRKGEARIELSVADLGEAGKIAGLADALNLRSSQETDEAYQKVGKVDGRFTEESYDRASRHGEYSVLVGKRFMVKAEGAQTSMDDIKAAVRTVDFGKLEQLASAAE